jgi:hypothetical protein
MLPMIHFPKKILMVGFTAMMSQRDTFVLSCRCDVTIGSSGTQ